MPTADPTTTISATYPFATRSYAGLAADVWGHDDDRAPLLLLHGLTFDRSIWRGLVGALQEVDPHRRLVSVDLPGHGQSPDQPSYDNDVLVRQLHALVEEAGLASPVVVGHSIGGGIASIYAATHPTRGVVNVDASPVLTPVAMFLRSIADRLRGPQFRDMWQVFYDSFHVELLPPAARALVASTCHPRQQVALGYWRALLEDPIDDVAGSVDEAGAAIGAAGIPYLYVAGSPLDPGTREWLDRQPFTADVQVWPRSGHFPHLAQPERFAAALAATAPWTRG